MTSYILKLLIMLPMVAGLAWGSLWLWRRYQPGLSQGAHGLARLRVVEALPLGATTRLYVVRFGAADVLVAQGRTGIVKLAEAPVQIEPAQIEPAQIEPAQIEPAHRAHTRPARVRP